MKFSKSNPNLCHGIPSSQILKYYQENVCDLCLLYINQKNKLNIKKNQFSDNTQESTLTETT